MLRPEWCNMILARSLCGCSIKGLSSKSGPEQKRCVGNPSVNACGCYLTCLQVNERAEVAWTLEDRSFRVQIVARLRHERTECIEISLWNTVLRQDLEFDLKIPAIVAGRRYVGQDG